MNDEGVEEELIRKDGEWGEKGRMKVRNEVRWRKAITWEEKKSMRMNENVTEMRREVRGINQVREGKT